MPKSSMGAESGLLSNWSEVVQLFHECQHTLTTKWEGLVMKPVSDRQTDRQMDNLSDALGLGNGGLSELTSW